MKDQGMFHDETEQHMEDIKNGAVAMLVVVRVRPLTSRQANVDSSEVVKVLDSKMIVMMDANSEESEKRGKIREAQFSFDYAYGQTATTKDIYDEALSGLLDGVLQGYNSTVLAYGATGCGKTYTMIGQQGKEGILALAMIDLLGRANELRRMKNVVIRISYIEIYNENIKDLLVSQDKNLDIREDPKEGVLVPGATEVTITSMLELATVLKVGAANRSKEATASNDASSRSHSLLLVRTESKDKAQGIKEETSVGKLTLVDLAGSERAGGQKGARQIQGAKINKSLLALGNCIQVLAENSSKSAFVPYRESKLTRLLKESLGGNCRTALIVNVTPFSGSWEENYNSLVYANRAKSIKNSATRNFLTSQAHLSNYIALIGNLKRENDELKKQLRGSKNHSLPQLKSIATVDGGQRMEMHRVQANIDAHFVQEQKIIEVISEITMKLDKAGFKLCRLHLDKNEKARKSHGKAEKNQEKMNKQIAQLSEQKYGFEQKLQELIFERGSLMAEIKTSELSQNSVSLLIAHYREKKVEMQLEEVRLRERRMEGQREEKEKFMGTLSEQLKIRDKIIEEQRLIIQKNNIINRITYSKIGSLNNNVFQDIFQAIGDAQKSLLPQEKTQAALFREKSTNKAEGEKVSLPKRKKQFFSNNQSLFFEPPQREEASFEKVKGLSSQSELLGLQPKGSILASKNSGKIVRNKSKQPNRQLDFVYMQR